ncbi:hypothetical protein BJP37_19800 [Moorena bouillonii PNG]|uniref:Uncharacterized protein n=1 Tax=Moorena bouillonii PNG TaxID=568701 RepID=A0A1U7N4R8_9CYAN|nr:hypothetical protein BJP37_19800 [Moorena bouillonii PNG]
MLLSAQKAKLLSFFDRKAGTFFDPTRLKPLSVNALRVNQQALINTLFCRYKPTHEIIGFIRL